MITGFVGVPGSGKSYEAVKKVLETIKLGRKVYTNIEGLEKPECKIAIQGYCNVTDYQLEVCLNHLDENQAREFWLHCEPGSLILIDEVHKLFSNRNWASEENKGFTEWASTHRHEGFDVVLITQSLEKIDKHARSLIEYTFLFSKVNFLGSLVSKTYICYIYHGDEHIGKPMSKNKRTYDVDIFPCYNSYVADDVQEMGAIKTPNIFRHPIFWSIPIVFGIAVYFFFHGSFFDGGIGAPTTTLAGIEPTEKKEGKKNAGKSLIDKFKGSPNIHKDKSVDTTETLNTKSLKDIISCYKLPDGSLVWTNNGNIPHNSKFIRSL